MKALAGVCCGPRVTGILRLHMASHLLCDLSSAYVAMQCAVTMHPGVLTIT